VTTGLRGDLAGKIIAITGGTQGVGGAAARRVAEWGAAGVLVVGRNAEKGATAAAELEKLGTQPLFVRADLADADAPGRIIEACEKTFGRIDGLVNAAAWTDRAGLLDASIDFLDRMYATNLRAPFLLMQGAANMMRRDRVEGAIVNVLSVNAYCGAPNLAAYAASKGGLATLTRNAANALAPDHIRVNGIMLGWVDTPAEHDVQRRESPDGADWLAKASARLPFGRLIDPEELADFIAFLLSRHAGVMTGALIDYNQMVLGAH
jgi:NAD(P)-dependent dehydrogenase (short-subunit alcohol dehydrogenase family)